MLYYVMRAGLRMGDPDPTGTAHHTHMHKVFLHVTSSFHHRHNTTTTTFPSLVHHLHA